MILENQIRKLTLSEIETLVKLIEPHGKVPSYAHFKSIRLDFLNYVLRMSADKAESDPNIHNLLIIFGLKSGELKNRPIQLSFESVT